MKVEQLLYVTLVKAWVRVWNGRFFERVAEFSTDPDGIKNFARHLETGPDRVTAVVIDIVQEEHYRDTIPHLGRTDQGNLLARKTAKAFGKTPYRTGIVQRRDEKNRNIDQVLITGVSRPEALRPWMQCLFDHHTPVAGIYTPALLSSKLLDKLRAPKSTTLLVTHRFDNRFRHTFFDGKHLVGSRLLRALDDGKMTAASFAQQLEESHHYFNPSYAPATNNKPEVVIACEPQIAQVLRPDDPALNAFVVHTIELPDGRERIGAPRSTGDTDVGYLYAHLVRSNRPRTNLAPPRDRRYASLRRLRDTARAACFAVLAVGVVAIGYNAIVAAGLDKESRQLLNAAEAADIDLREIEARLPALRVDPNDMKRSVMAYNQLVANDVNPTDLFTVLSRALDALPMVQVDGISWSTSAQEISGTASSTATVEINSTTALALSFAGRVTPFDGDYTSAFDVIDQFVMLLEAQKAVVSVTREELPLDVNPRNTLVGEIAEADKQREATFSLTLTMRANNEKV